MSKQVVMILVWAMFGISTKSQSIFMNQFLPNSNDTIYYQFTKTGPSELVSRNYQTKVQEGENCFWNYSSLNGGQLGLVETMLVFERNDQNNWPVPWSNLKVCYNYRTQWDDLNYRTEYWQVEGDSLFDRAVFRGDDLDCDTSNWDSRQLFGNSTLRLLFPLGLDDIWEEKANYGYDIRGFTNWHSSQALEGSVNVSGVGTLKTPYNTIENCTLITERYYQYWDDGDAQFNRWTWIRPHIAWPICVYKEWIDTNSTPNDSTANHSFEWLIRTGQSDQELSVEQVPETKDLRVSPNPSGGVIRFDAPITGILEVRDMVGKLVISEYLQNRTEFDFANLQQGFYVISVGERSAKLCLLH